LIIWVFTSQAVAQYGLSPATSVPGDDGPEGGDSKAGKKMFSEPFICGMIEKLNNQSDPHATYYC